jgi:hypothetical protein
MRIGAAEPAKSEGGSREAAPEPARDSSGEVVKKKKKKAKPVTAE